MPQSSLSIARQLAYDAFVQVMDEQKRPEDCMEILFTENASSLRRLDRNFIKEVLYGSLRWYSKIYWILQNTSRRDLDKSTPQIRAALVCGTYQIFYMDRVPDRAAVNESVEYVRQRGQASACTFVNGILRQISRRAEYFAKPDKQKQSVDYLSLQFAHPRWIVDRWHQRFKFEKMEVMLAANNQPPPNSIRTNNFKVPTDEVHKLQQDLLRQEKTHSERRPLRICLRLKEFPKVDEGSLFADGYYTIQDEAAQLIGYLVDPQAKQTIVDACCGPGGKLSHVFELADGQAHLIGIDKSKDRLLKAQETNERLGHLENITYLCEDFAKYKPEQAPDKILLDAPCSGLGVLRKHPEGKWQKQSSIIERMCTEQRKMISHAIELLPSGGELIYSVCSFEKEETEDQLAWLMKQYKDQLDLVSPITRLPDYYKRYVTRQNILLIFAGNQDDMDGFGAFVVKKK